MIPKQQFCFSVLATVTVIDSPSCFANSRLVYIEMCFFKNDAYIYMSHDCSNTALISRETRGRKNCVVMYHAGGFSDASSVDNT